MKIALILHPIQESAPAGLGRSVYQFARGLIEARPADTFIVVSKDPLPLHILFPGAKNIQKQINIGNTSFWASTRLCGLRHEVERVVCFTPVIPLFLFHRHIIVFAHDFAFMEFGSISHRITLWLLYYVTFKKSRHICAVSRFTAEETQRLFRVHHSKVSVVYNGYDHLPTSSSHPAPDTTQPTFLSVGVVKERKNTLRIVQAFERISAKHPNARLMIVGSLNSTYGQGVYKYVLENNLSDRVSFPGHISDRELENLYSSSMAFVYPSLIEGFGFPILEAMSHGLPVITSNCGALAEIAGDAAVLVNPCDADSIALGMESIFTASVREECITRGLKNCVKYTWGTSVRALSDVVDRHRLGI